MDFVATLTEGVILGLPWVVLGSLTALLARKWLIRVVLNQIMAESVQMMSEIARYPEAYEDLTAPISAGAVNIVGIAMSRLASDVQKNPDKYAAILKPVLMKAIKDATAGGGGGMPRFKWQDLVGVMLQRFVGNLAQEGPKKLAEAATEANPFA